YKPYDAQCWLDGLRAGRLSLENTTVEAMLRARGEQPLILGLSKDGHPKHPLYISYAQQPYPWW
ncbi:MAG: hypothetical protein AAFV09_16845, partial [Pseudomonadota bacterium]